MSPWTRALSFFALSTLVLVGCGAPSESGGSAPYRASFGTTSCPFTFLGGTFKQSEVRCGYLVVPVNRQIENGKTIKLAVAVFKSSSPNPAPDPLVYLEGGPGSPLVSNLGPSIVSTGMPDYVGNRDLILVDQRGAGLSQPSLACHSNEVLHNCRIRLGRARISLASYNNVESAADIADLGPALGYKTVDLFGNSYGSTLALQVMRDHPRGVRSVVLDGITGPTFNSFSDYNANIWHGLQQVFRDCLSSSLCRDLHPHIQQTFTRLLARLQVHPARVEGFSTALDRDVSSAMRGTDLWRTMREIVADPTGPPIVPSIIESFARGDYHVAVGFVGITMAEGQPDQNSLGMHYAMTCSADQSTSTPATIKARSQMVPASIRSAAIADAVSSLDVCQMWHVPSIPAVNRTYFRSSIPTLLLPGRYDPKTPPFLARALAPRLGHAYLVPIPRLSHVVVGYDPCPDSIASAFLAHPNRKPDTSCASRMAMTWE